MGIIDVNLLVLNGSHKSYSPQLLLMQFTPSHC